jgi:hypothetical protein
MNRMRAFACFALGVVVTLAAQLLLGAARPDEGQVGRYQISNSDHFAFIIDTANGTVLRKKLYENDNDWGIQGEGDFYANKLKPAHQ